MDSQLPKTEARKTKIMDYARILDFKLVVIASRILSLEHAYFGRYISLATPHRVGADIDATRSHAEEANAIAHGFSATIVKPISKLSRGGSALLDARKKGRAAAKPPRLSRNSYFNF
jgi:hypothetical protein